MSIGPFKFLERIRPDGRRIPGFVPRHHRPRLARWAKRAHGSEGLLTAWNWEQRCAVFYFWKGGRFHLCGEARLDREQNFRDMMDRFRLCKQPKVVKKTWNRWWSAREANERRIEVQRMNAALRPELLNMMMWRMKAREGGRKRRKQSHLIEINPLAAARKPIAGSQD